MNNAFDPKYPWTTTAEIIGMKRDLRRMRVVYNRNVKLYDEYMSNALGKADFAQLVQLSAFKAMIDYMGTYLNEKGIEIKRKRQRVADKKAVRINTILGDFDANKHVDARQGFINYGIEKLKVIGKKINNDLSENTYQMSVYNDTLLLSYGFLNISLKVSNIDAYKDFKNVEKVKVNTTILTNKYCEDSVIKHLKAKQNISVNSDGNYYWVIKFTDKDTKEVTYAEVVIL